MKSRAILNFLKFSEKLKIQKRSILKSDKNHESVADHSWQLALFAVLVEPHLKYKVDLLKSLKMILIHDLVEAEIGDLPYYDGLKDSELVNDKDALEKGEIEKIKNMISSFDIKLGKEIFELWYEYKARKTKESVFVKALDSIEANFQSLILDDITYWGNIEHEVFLNKADKYCSGEKILSELNEEIKNKMKKEIVKVKTKVSSKNKSEK